MIKGKDTKPEIIVRKFTGRFRVKLLNEPTTMVTSHILKDGHYFFHSSLQIN